MAAKVAYIAAQCAFQCFCLYIAVWGPSIGWTIGAIVLMLVASAGMTARMNSWGGFGNG